MEEETSSTSSTATRQRFRLRSAAADAAHQAHEEDKQRGGCILVFLPGAREVDECCQLLKAVLRDGNKPADLIGVYAGADKRALKQAATPSSRRRICVATSSPRPPAPLPMRVAIDAGFERLLVFDENANAEVVATTYASQQTADRRAARAGSPARRASATGSTRRRPSGPSSPRSTSLRVAAVGACCRHAPIESGRRLQCFGFRPAAAAYRTIDLRRVRGAAGIARHRRSGRTDQARRGAASAGAAARRARRAFCSRRSRRAAPRRRWTSPVSWRRSGLKTHGSGASRRSRKGYSGTKSSTSTATTRRTSKH